jgi:hypothetical protein
MSNGLDFLQICSQRIFQDLIKNKPDDLDPFYEEAMIFAIKMSNREFKLHHEQQVPDDEDQKEAYVNLAYSNDTLAMIFIDKASKKYQQRYLDIDKKQLELLAPKFCELKCLAIVGAGLSFHSNLGKMIDEHLYFCLKNYNYSVNTEVTKHNNYEKWIEYWKILAGDKHASTLFRKRVIHLCKDKNPNYNHALVASFYGIGFLKNVICLNWDALIKDAYKIISPNFKMISYNRIVLDTRLNPDKIPPTIWKVHGCISDKEKKWYFPGESSISNALKKLYGKSSPRSEIVIILGSSLTDEAVVDFINNHLFGRTILWIDPYADPSILAIFSDIPCIDKETAEILYNNGINSPEKLRYITSQELKSMGLKFQLAEKIKIQINENHLSIPKIILPLETVFKYIFWWLKENGYKKHDLDKLQKICFDNNLFKPEMGPELT